MNMNAYYYKIRRRERIPLYNVFIVTFLIYLIQIYNEYIYLILDKFPIFFIKQHIYVVFII